MAFDCFLEIQGIPGESTDDKHKDWIEVLSYEIGASMPTSGARSQTGSASSGRVNLTDFVITKQLDKATPMLFSYCTNGKSITKITCSICHATENKEEYMRYTMEDVIVSSTSTGGASGGDGIPLETVCFNFGKITETYTEFDHGTGAKKGSIEKFWSPKENKGG